MERGQSVAISSNQTIGLGACIIGKHFIADVEAWLRNAWYLVGPRPNRSTYLVCKLSKSSNVDKICDSSV